MSGFCANSFPPKPTFSVDHISDLTGQVVIVTGGNTGIGKETVKVLLKHNAKVYIAGRNIQKVTEAIQEVFEETGKQAHSLTLDLANLKSISAAVANFQSKETELHVLFNSAGVMFPAVESVTEDGYDLQFGTNVLGHFYLTKLLLPTLLSTASSTPGGKVRVINTSSMGHTYASKIEYDSLKDGPKRVKLGTHKLYFQSKFANILFSHELHRRYGSQGIVSISLHPGNLKTDLQRHGSKLESFVASPLLYPAPMGALTQLYAGTMPEAAEYGGKYMIPWARLGEPKKQANDPELAAELWAWLEAQA